MVFCVRTTSFHVIPASCQHPLRTLVICKIQNSLSKNSWMILFFYTVELLEPLGHRPQVHFAGIKEYEFSNNPFPSTWLLRLNIRKRFFFFSHVWSKLSCKGYTMFIKFHFWMLFMYHELLVGIYSTHSLPWAGLHMRRLDAFYCILDTIYGFLTVKH